MAFDWIADQSAGTLFTLVYLSLLAALVVGGGWLFSLSKEFQDMIRLIAAIVSLVYFPILRNAQYRNNESMQAKIDALLAPEQRNQLAGTEDFPAEEAKAIKHHVERSH